MTCKLKNVTAWLGKFTREEREIIKKILKGTSLILMLIPIMSCH